jgi:hypothetical protein
MNLLGAKKSMKMKGKKKTKMKVPVNTETKMNMKKIIEANAKLNIKVKMNMNVKMKLKLKLNTILQMGMRCCRFAGYLGDQVKAAGADRTTARRRSPRPPSRMKLR